ncbi:MAG: hypothetical protein DYG87_00700 [Anaerolineae bacterium CFX3]|nr:hypothetical protein [Anaerolineae bacterium CFX3]MCQ3946112.1 hypothetical protein [Anaerolineae bacterium]RIK27533.1 MAG: hypothetical protein DCC54_02665 [Anaerolineae bacterium]
MDLFFPEDLAPRAAPEETRVIDLRAEPYPDRTRVRVNMEIVPFQTRPYVDVTLLDADGSEIAATSFVEPMTWKLEFTLHIRGKADPAGGYRLEARLYYPDGPAAEPVSFEFEIPKAE